MEWEVLDRETGAYRETFQINDGVIPRVYPWEVAYCPENGQVHYLPAN